MHVAFVNLHQEFFSPERGGALATCILQQARRLQDRGLRVSVLSRADQTEPFYQGLDVIRVPVRERHHLPAWRRAVARGSSRVRQWDVPLYGWYAAGLRRAVRRLRPDAAVCFNDLRAPAIVKAASPGTRTLVRLSNEVRTRGGTAQRNDGVLAVSRYIRDWAVRHHGLDPGRVVTLHNGTDRAAFAAEERPPRRTGDPLRVLFVGRVCADKGPDLAVEAVRRLRDEGRDVRLTLAGSTWWGVDAPRGDAYYDRVRAAADAIGSPGVVALGHVPRGEVPALFARHDVVVVPSRWQDPGPQVVFEGMASGATVVAADRGGIPESLEGAGVLFDPDKDAGLTDALRRLDACPERLAEVQARCTAAGRFWTWDRNAYRLEEILRGGPRALAGLVDGPEGQTWSEALAAKQVPAGVAS